LESPAIEVPAWFASLRDQDCAAVAKATGCAGFIAKMMCEVGNVLATHEVLWWVQYGTLIGALREGDFLRDDDDQDIGIMLESYARYFTPDSPKPNPVEVALSSRGYQIHDWGKISPILAMSGCDAAVVETWPMCFNGTDGRLPSPTTEAEASLGEQLYYCDCQEMHYDQKHFLTREEDGRYVATLDKVQMGPGGLELPAPMEGEEYLTKVYGNWRVPAETRANEAC